MSDATSPQDDAAAAMSRLQAKEARRAARTAAIRDDIGEILPVRRRDLTHDDMRQELAGENRSRVLQRLANEEDIHHEQQRERRRAQRERLRVSHEPGTGDDPDLSAAVARTPVRGSLSASGQLSSTLGYAPPMAAQTMQPMAASYFTGNASAEAAATVMPLPPAAAPNTVPHSASPRGSNLPPRPLALPSSIATAAFTTLTSGIASGQARHKVGVSGTWQEDIGTGDFRRVDAGLMRNLGAKMVPGVVKSAALLQAQAAQESSRGGGCCGCGGSGGMGASVAELDAGQRESMYGDVGLIMQSACRIAQGLLAGTLLVIILQLDRLRDPVTFIQFMAPVLPPLRIIMHVLSVLAFLGSAEQAIETRDILGAWSSQYAVISDAASLRLSGTIRYTWGATLAYLAACLTVFASMPFDNQLRMLGAKTEFALKQEKGLDALISTWTGILSLRFALVLLGMLASMFAASTPSVVYRAMKEQADRDLEEAGAGGRTGYGSGDMPAGAAAPGMHDDPRASMRGSVLGGSIRAGSSVRGPPTPSSAAGMMSPGM